MKAAVVTLVVLIALTISGVALADSPHWNKASDSINSSGQLLCSFKESGLGTISATTITCSATGTAVYVCINGGGNHPKAANKETVTSPVSGGGSFAVRNGQTTGSVTVDPPGPGSFSCPNGQKLVLASVSYTNVTLSGEAGDLALSDQSLVLVNV
jgi:hypothetical protein